MPVFETHSLTMERVYLVIVQTPVEDADRIMEAVQVHAPLQLGSYDRNSYETQPGFERYRPLEGAAAGAETETRKRPGVSTICFQLPLDHGLLATVVEAIFQIHSYQEPVILVQEILASRSKGLDDRANPNRWWNTTGDWKKSAG